MLLFPMWSLQICRENSLMTDASMPTAGAVLLEVEGPHLGRGVWIKGGDADYPAVFSTVHTCIQHNSRAFHDVVLLPLLESTCGYVTAAACKRWPSFEALGRSKMFPTAVKCITRRARAPIDSLLRNRQL